MKSWTLILLLTAAVSGSSLAQTVPTSYPCQPAPEVRQALDNSPSMADYRIPFQERLKPLLALLEKHPHDLFFHLYYQDLFRKHPNLYEEFDRAFAIYRSKPNDPVFRYLEARLTGSFNAQMASEMFDDLLAKEPSFPWAHLGIAELTDREGSRDAKRAEVHLRSFLAACSSSVQGYAMLRTVEDPEMIRDGAVKLRTLLEARADSWSLPYWRYLWDLEFRATPKESQEAVRMRVLKDAASLEKLPLPPTAEEYKLLQYAVDLTKDPSILDLFEKGVLDQFLGSPIAVTVERARWLRGHPRPGSGAKPEETRAYAELAKAHQEELQKRWPQDPDAILDRFLAMPKGTSLPLEERLAITDAYSSMRHLHPDVYWSSTPLSIELAGLYVQWGVRLDQVQAMVQEGLRDAQFEGKYQLDPSMYPEEIRKTAPNQTLLPIVQADLRGQQTLANLYLSKQKLDQARDAIQIGLANLNRSAFLSGSQAATRDAETRRQSWLPQQARLADLEGNSEKALLLYQQYLQPIAKIISGTTNLVLVSELRDLIAQIKGYYLAHGGKEESWLEWVASGPKPDSPKIGPEPLQFNVMLPGFETKDINGKVWRSADLKGKTTLIDVWATWCGSCREAHPELQKLYDAIKGRKDIQLLSFSRDETAYLAESYMKEKKYTFPVIVSKDLVDKLFPAASLPMSWIIDAKGRRSSPYMGRDSADRVIADLETVAGKKK